jgi:hypothetical protein
MSAEQSLNEPGGPGVTPNDFEDAGDLFIRDLPSTATAGPALGAQSREEDEPDEDDGMVTTMMLGEEGDRGGGQEKREKKDKGDEGIVTTMALGEEGDRGGGVSS